MKLLLLLTIFLYLNVNLFSQAVFIRGKVTSKETGQELPFANLRVANSSMGTSSNKNGEFELKITPGKYTLIASYIGYVSDTVIVNADYDISGIRFELNETHVDLPEIVVLPGENPAVGIIRKAIEQKNKRKSILKSYEFEAYTKGLIRSKEEIESQSSNVTLTSDEDSSEMKITGIIENESKGFYKDPEEYKEIITARKQSANLPPSLNVLSGGRLIKSFYENDIDFFSRNIPGPLADNALDYYYYFIVRTDAIDSIPVYEIHIEPDNSTDPGFTGTIFITGTTYDLIKIDLGLNRAANTGGIFDSVRIFQQFSLYNNTVYMPVDYHLAVTANVLNLFEFGFELNTILYNYKINPGIDDAVFTQAIVTVLPEADSKDSLYWVSTQRIPNTEEEVSAYKRIDSVENAPKTFWDEFSILSSRIKLSENFYTSAPLSMYHFNRVEGHALDMGFFADGLADNRLDAFLNISYGFSDKDFKKWFSTQYFLGEYRTTKLSLNVFDRINILFGNSDAYNEITATLIALIGKYEFRDYYYSKGFSLGISSEVFPVVELRGSYINRTDNTAYVNSNYSFFNKEKKYRSNPPVTEAKTNAVMAGFKLDFRKYIEDGMYRRRVGTGRSFAIVEGNITHSGKDFLKSTYEFSKFDVTLYGALNTFKSATLDYRIYSQYSSGTTPFQLLYALPGNIDAAAQDFTFRTLNINEMIGDNIVTVNLEHNWSDLLFKLLRIPLLKDAEVQLNTFISMAYTNLNNSSRALIPYEQEVFKKPFYEAGFSIWHVLFPIGIDFSWKLNYRGHNNFRVGINSVIL